ncbi:MvaI/BcnI restriction endonuclease family protein [Ruminococcaceae bacterium R-25]|nr:MvaI/BcnI restriction endonuclease family protein [Ruminococcaceae bacterium R-25]SUQ11009.1 MvaI/BcnI restriction endonuclease family protein [Oscillospiraceae bacterium]
MIFTPYKDEQAIISIINSIRGDDYVLIRLTPTMIEKNNIDANSIFRDLLKDKGLVDYDLLINGSENGVSHTAVFIEKDKVEDVKMKFYKVNNDRGDRRFSIESIKRKMSNGQIKVGDLLYISTFTDSNGEEHIFIVDLTSNVPTSDAISSVIGFDETYLLLNSIKKRLKEIVEMGWVDNSKGVGDEAPKDMGDTLESLLSIKTNNSPAADLGGLIEIKSKGESNTKDTLFTLRPQFDGTDIETIEPSDKNRVSAFTRYYGYLSDKHPDSKSLYITIGAENAPQNNYGFYLDVDDVNSRIKLMHKRDGKRRIAAYWTFEQLRNQLEAKHPSTLWFEAQTKMEGNIVKFNYKHIEFTRSPQFTTFLAMIKDGSITYDWRGYTSVSGKYVGKNHGNAWRINPKARNALFGSTTKLF